MEYNKTFSIYTEKKHTAAAIDMKILLTAFVGSPTVLLMRARLLIKSASGKRMKPDSIWGWWISSSIQNHRRAQSPIHKFHQMKQQLCGDDAPKTSLMIKDLWMITRQEWMMNITNTAILENWTTILIFTLNWDETCIWFLQPGVQIIFPQLWPAEWR